MSSGTSTQATQSSSVNQIPQWVSDAGQQNYAFAQNVANQPLTQYQGQMVADTSPQTQQAWNLAAQSGNVGQDQFAGAQAGYLNSLGQNIQSVNAGGPTMQVNAGGPTQQVSDPGNASSIRASTIANTNLSPYLNPYTQNVINSTMPIYQQALGQQQVGNQNQASGANAFGGSRMGVQQGVTQAQGAQGMAQMASQLNQSNFQQAQAAAQADAATRNQVSTTNQANQQANLNRNLTAQTTNQAANAADLNRSLQAQTANQSANAADLNRSLQAQTTNQGAAQSKINSDILSSQGLTNLGTAQEQANAANYTMLSTAGAQEQGQAQDQINAQMAKFTQANQYPQQQLATLLSSLGMTPQDTASTGTSNTQTTTPTNWGALALGGLQDLSGFFKASDRSLKTDIKKLGKDPTTGLQMHAYRYKGDPKTYPKVVGPMAEEVEKKFPGATAKVGGKMVVHPAIMDATKHYAKGTARVPGALSAGDSVPSMLTPGEAILNQHAATMLGRGKIKALNMGVPPSTPLVAAGLKPITAGRTLASFMPTKRAMHMGVTALRGGSKSTGGMSNTKVRGALA